MTTANIVVAIVALLHLYILILEMFLWDKPQGLRVFGLGQDLATKTKVLGANQGLYNGFLAAGLIWGLLMGDSGTDVKIFFLCCVAIAGIYGAWSTQKMKILYIQTAPAALGLLLLIMR